MTIPVQYLVNTTDNGEKYLILEDSLPLQDLHDNGEYLDYRLYDSTLDNVDLILKKFDALPSDSIFMRYQLLNDSMPFRFLQYEQYQLLDDSMSFLFLEYENEYFGYEWVDQISYTPDDYLSEQHVVDTSIVDFVPEKFLILSNILPLEFQKLIDSSYLIYKLFDANIDVQIIAEGIEYILHEPTNTLVVKNAPFIPLWFEKFNPDTALYVVDWRYATQQEIDDYNTSKEAEQFETELQNTAIDAKNKLLMLYGEFKGSSWFYITNGSNQLPVKGASVQRLQELMSNSVNSEVIKELIYSLNGFVAFEILVNDVKTHYRPTITKAENTAYNIYNQFLAKIDAAVLNKDLSAISNILNSLTVNIFDVDDSIIDGKISIIIPETDIQAIYETQFIGTEQQTDIRNDVQKVIELLSL